MSFQWHSLKTQLENTRGKWEISAAIPQQQPIEVQAGWRCSSIMMTERLPPGQSFKSLHPAHVSTSSWVTWRVWRKQTELSTVLKCCDGKNAMIAWFQGWEGHIFQGLCTSGKSSKERPPLCFHLFHDDLCSTHQRARSKRGQAFQGNFAFRKKSWAQNLCLMPIEL